MIKLLTYAGIFYLGYRYGTMTPDERAQLLANAQSRLSDLKTLAFGPPVTSTSQTASVQELPNPNIKLISS